MILVRNVFQLKFGQARPALAHWKDGMQIVRRLRPKDTHRVLTDVTGPSYTIVFEGMYENLAEFEQSARTVMGNDEWQKWYQKFVPLVDSAYREIFTVVE
jgi:hypothetical protein